MNPLSRMFTQKLPTRRDQAGSKSLAQHEGVPLILRKGLEHVLIACHDLVMKRSDTSKLDKNLPNPEPRRRRLGSTLRGMITPQ